jgi:hypothetical protein
MPAKGDFKQGIEKGSFFLKAVFGFMSRFL